ncbi:hypothetical protein MNBD_ALPHA12-2132 [hydrothermal vent metagenome]|uniref:DUF3572 domain-containing protein n=1 Tax=hydrothermal vent metagenome TaxID=652676 RepID=A0A3B0UTA2_9ZZZZ
MTFTSRFPEDEKKQKSTSHKQFAEAALGYLAAAPDELARFMAAAGYDPDQLRSAIDSNELDLALMDYFATNEPALLAMCSNMKLDVESFMAAWRRLNGAL